MTAEERQCLIDYFAQLRPKRWQQWEHTLSGAEKASAFTTTALLL
jgi:hypothetical protein